MTDVSTLADLYERGDLHAVKGLLEGMAALEPAPLEALVVRLYLEIVSRSGVEAATRFLFGYLTIPGTPTSLLAPVIALLFDQGQMFAAANLSMGYIEFGGTEIRPYEICISYLLSENKPELVRDFYLKVKDRIDLADLRVDLLFNMASHLSGLKLYAESAALCLLIINRDPSFNPAVVNLHYLAQMYSVPSAMEFMLAQSDVIARSFPRYAPESGVAQAEAAQRFDGQSVSEIVDAINQNGFCFLRAACFPEAVERIRSHAMELDALKSQYPTKLTDYIKEQLPDLFRFDADAVLKALLMKEVTLDVDASILRKVAPSEDKSFLPFHQDSTAFAKMIANIWTPLTGAGGDYPTLQLIRKRIDYAEQIKLDSIQHHLIEIETDHILKKYQGLLYEIEAAEPGDCVLFLGTTIHRSYNPAGATKTRFSIEVRWS